MTRDKLAQRISEMCVVLSCSPDVLTQSLDDSWNLTDEQREESRKWMHTKLDRELHVIAETMRLLAAAKGGKQS